jgi:hypothetical protein
MARFQICAFWKQRVSFAFCANLRNLRETILRFIPRKEAKLKGKGAKEFLQSKNCICENLRNPRETKIRFIHFNFSIQTVFHWLIG